jgi:hypothetical protein
MELCSRDARHCARRYQKLWHPVVKIRGRKKLKTQKVVDDGALLILERLKYGERFSQLLQTFGVH